MLTLKDWGNRLAFTACGNTVVAVILWLVGGHDDFIHLFIVAQCIGLSCLLVAMLLRVTVFRRRHFPFVLSILFAVGIGLPLGAWLAYHAGIPLEGHTLGAAISGAWRYALLAAAVSFAFHFYYRNQAQMRELEAARRESELREANVQKSALRAHLAALQAQIEPHFLFNTLANLHSLIGRDDAAARSLLEKINAYLRATLAHSRAEHATLGDECRMLSAYLAIQAQRMGGRLHWQIGVPDALQGHPFPPMLLQPLVENAIVHGVEPKLGEGLVHLLGEEQGACLHLCVCDDGAGFDAAGGNGVGLANVRERLDALFGSAARLQIKELPAGGVSAELWIPLDTPAH